MPGSTSIAVSPTPAPTPVRLDSLKTHKVAQNVSERLGHSTVAFTLNTYAHVMDGMGQPATRKIGNVLQAAIAKDRKSAR